jgi:transcriptional regulator with XRE-family HTH domain
MSIIVCNQDDFGRVINRKVWGRIFGLFIRKGREKRGYSVEQVAVLAGLEPSVWAAFEAGRVPETVVQLRSMAGALAFSDRQLATVVQLCRDAWPA